MKEVKQNSIKQYEEEKITETVAVKYTKVENQNGTSINGTLTKDGASVGDVNYSEQGKLLILRLKPCDLLTPEERTAVFQAVPSHIDELTN